MSGLYERNGSIDDVKIMASSMTSKLLCTYYLEFKTIPMVKSVLFYSLYGFRNTMAIANNLAIVDNKFKGLLCKVKYMTK